MADRRKSDFSKLFLESVDEALNQILGGNLVNTVYHHLQGHYSLEKKEVPIKVKEFAKALEESFGAEALIIEKIIARILYAKLEIDFTEREGFDFVDHIDFTKRKMEKRK